MDRREFMKDSLALTGAAVLGLGCSKEATPNENHTEDKEKSPMKFTELIEVRRSVRRYAKSEIAKDEMEKIVADALNAPSWKNSETTRYYAAIGDEAKNRMWKEALPGFNAANSADAAALVAVTFVPGESGFMGSEPADDLGNRLRPRLVVLHPRGEEPRLGHAHHGNPRHSQGQGDPRHSRRRDPHVRHRRRQSRGKAHQGSAQARRRCAEDGLRV